MLNRAKQWLDRFRGSGDLALTFNSGDVEASAVSGDLSLGGRLTGEVAVETVSGNMRVDSKGERLRRLSVETVSGDADLKVALLPDGEISMESVSGDLTLTVQAAASPAGPWSDLAASNGGGAFAALIPGTDIDETGTGDVRAVEVRDLYLRNDPAHPRRFMRLHVER